MTSTCRPGSPLIIEAVTVHGRQPAAGRAREWLIPRPVAFTSGPITGTFSNSGLVTTATLAATLPRASKIGAATEALPIDISSRETANPVLRISARARRNADSLVMVYGVRGCRPAAMTRSSKLGPLNAMSTLPGPAAYKGRRRPTLEVTETAPRPEIFSTYNASTPSTMARCTTPRVASYRSSRYGSAISRRVRVCGTSAPRRQSRTPSRYLPRAVRSTAPQSTSTASSRWVVAGGSPVRLAMALTVCSGPLSAKHSKIARPRSSTDFSPVALAAVPGFSMIAMVFRRMRVRAAPPARPGPTCSRWLAAGTARTLLDRSSDRLDGRAVRS